MTAGTAPEETLGRIAEGDAPVLETLVAMNLDAMERSGLDVNTYFLVRLAALVAMDAAPISYTFNFGDGTEDSITLEQAQGMLVAIAPLVGTARVAAAAGNILRALAGAALIGGDEVPEPRTP